MSESIKPPKPPEHTTEGLKERRDKLAKLLIAANTKGVTRGMDLSDRLDPLELIDFPNYRRLLRDALKKYSGRKDIEDEKRKVAEELIEALDAFEARLHTDDIP